MPFIDEPRKKRAEVIDIMTLLKRSVEKAGKGRSRARGRQSA
jgi:non-homologous end joining protein Ku